jgi:hypothetical protein
VDKASLYVGIDTAQHKEVYGESVMAVEFDLGFDRRGGTGNH